MKYLFRGNVLTLPNLLSAFRICLIPFFVWLYLSQNNLHATALVLLVSGITDILDGLIARHFHMISDLGKALDPLADKLTQLAMLCCLLLRFPRMAWLIGVICVKEIFVAATGLAVIRRTEQVIGADWHGKISTVLLYATMILHLLWQNIPKEVSWTLILMCMAVATMSGVLYGVRNIGEVKKEANPGLNREKKPEKQEG